MDTNQEEELERFVHALRAMPSRDGLFNPYNSQQSSEIPAAHDELGPLADDIRTGNLRSYLRELVDAGSDVILCGEAPGYQGCRFSGVAFTSEREIADGKFPFQDCHLLPEAASRSRPRMEEPSALFVWRAMARASVPAVLWNSVQLHPHLPGKPLTNRKPTKEEVELGRESLTCLIRLVRPRLVLAIGRVAEEALQRIGRTPSYVRHPARGGSNDFLRGLEDFGVIAPAPPEAQHSLF